MGFFDIFRQPDINQGVSDYKNSAGALLLDVRTREEYRAGHVPGSVNLPLNSMDGIASLAKDMQTPVFVYCQSGARSRQACGILGRMGYSNVKNIGGIAGYYGKVER